MYMTTLAIMITAKIGSLFILMYLQYALIQAYNNLYLTVGF